MSKERIVAIFALDMQHFVLAFLCCCYLPTIYKNVTTFETQTRTRFCAISSNKRIIYQLSQKLFRAFLWSNKIMLVNAKKLNKYSNALHVRIMKPF